MKIVLGVGEVTETVTVSGQATLLKLTDTTVAHGHDGEVLEVLPVHMSFFIRQSTVLIDTLPGVSFRETWDGGQGIIHGVGGDGPHGNPIGYSTDGLRWPRLVGQLGGLFKMYSSCHSYRQNLLGQIFLSLLLRL